jgi:hypothetical protein
MNEVAKTKNTELPAIKNESSAVLSMIERVALDPNSDVEKLEKMLDMQERVLDRNARMDFDSALPLMQAELPEVEKLAQGHNSNYAKFEHILAAIKPFLLAHGFSITHRVNSEGNTVKITGVLSHRSGHREETTLELPIDTSGNKNDVQAVASSTEYGRRYTMNSLIGIATKDADKDGGTGGDKEPDCTDWISKIEESADFESLKKNYTDAWKENDGQQFNQQKINAAKDRRKKELAK